MRVAAVLAILCLAACKPQAEGVVSDSAGQTTAKTQNATWGNRYTWPDGIAVEVAAPVACKPGKYTLPENIKRAVRLKVTIFNDGKKPFESGLLTFGSDAQFAGAKAEKVINVGDDGDCKGSIADNATVLPGKSYSFEVSYAVGAQPGELQLTFQPSFDNAKAIYVGPA